VKTRGDPQECCFVGQSVPDFCKDLQIKDVLGKYSTCTKFDALPQNSALNIKTQQENFALVQQFWTYNNFPIKLVREAALTFKISRYHLQMSTKMQTCDAKAGNYKTIECQKDSKATNFHALNAALLSFNKKAILIAGGKSKNEPIEKCLK
jgi:UDP-N-acetylmuramoylalanine-D-glutamate ligase